MSQIFYEKSEVGKVEVNAAPPRVWPCLFPDLELVESLLYNDK